MIATFIARFLPSFGFLTNPWVLLGVLAYTVAVASFSAFQGYQAGESKYYKYIASEAANTVRFFTRIVELTNTIRVPYIKRETEVVTQYVYLESEAKNVPSRATCNITAGWLRVHDSAAEGLDKPIVGRVDDATDTGIKEADALRQTILPNYRAFHQTANDLIACRAFVNGLGDAFVNR